jgi:hypothetical protein
MAHLKLSDKQFGVEQYFVHHDCTAFDTLDFDKTGTRRLRFNVLLLIQRRIAVMMKASRGPQYRHAALVRQRIVDKPAASTERPPPNMPR